MTQLQVTEMLLIQKTAHSSITQTVILEWLSHFKTLHLCRMSTGRLNGLSPNYMHNCRDSRFLRTIFWQRLISLSHFNDDIQGGKKKRNIRVVFLGEIRFLWDSNITHFLYKGSEGRCFWAGISAKHQSSFCPNNKSKI